MIIDGKRIAEEVLAHLRDRSKPATFFGAALVGDDPASAHFVAQKEKVARSLGIDFRLYRFPADVSTDTLRRDIGRIAAPKTCGGFIVQLPLPVHVNRHYVLNAIPKEKDVDCLSESALGAFYTGRGKIAPPSVATVEEILRRELGGVDKVLPPLRSLKAVVVGAGFLIGRPVGFWLQNRVGELVVIDAEVRDVHAKLIDADIVVSGAGHPHLFGAEHLKPSAIVIDFGYGRNAEGRIAGDFAPAGEEEKDIRYTRTPGGTGPLLVAKLYENFYILNS